MVETVNSIGNANANVYEKMPPKSYSGIYHPENKKLHEVLELAHKNTVGPGQVIVTKSGKHIFIPQMLGSETHVYPLPTGEYLVSYKPVVLNAKPKFTIMTEEQLVEKYGAKNTTHRPGQILKTVA